MVKNYKNNFVDISIDDDKLLIQRKRDFILQQVKLIFDTTPGDLLGEETFGTDFQKYMWEIRLGNSALEQVVSSALNNIDLCGYTADVSVDMYQGTLDDIAIINIKFYDPNTTDTFTETYKIY